MQEILSNETISITIKRRKDSVTRGAAKFFALLFGGLGMFISGLLFLTIIGIFPAIGLFFTSLGLIYVAQGKEQVACPHCKKKQPVLKSSENFTCPKCQKLTVINWA